jgi:hypothetical protein
MDDAALRRIQDALNDNGYQKYCAWADGSSDATESSIEDYCALLDAAEAEKPVQKFLTASRGCWQPRREVSAAGSSRR